MKKITLALFSVLGLSASAQVTLINPAAEGGFEIGTTFAENGWSVAQQAGNNKKWYLGTGQTGFTGTQSAFIGNSPTVVGNAAAARTVHLYRSITLPATAQNIVLTFKYKQAVSDVFGGSIYDYIVVSTGTDLPVNGDLPTGTIHFGPFPDADLPNYTTQTVALPNSLAGSTTNLIFTFNADNVDPRGFGAIDDVSLTYTDPSLGLNGSSKSVIVYYPNPVKDMLTLSYSQTISDLRVYDILGNEVLRNVINAKDAQVDLSSLSSGTYIAKIAVDGGSKTVRITKE